MWTVYRSDPDAQKNMWHHVPHAVFADVDAAKIKGQSAFLRSEVVGQFSSINLIGLALIGRSSTIHRIGGIEGDSRTFVPPKCRAPGTEVQWGQLHQRCLYVLDLDHTAEIKSVSHQSPKKSCLESNRFQTVQHTYGCPASVFLLS